MHQYARYAEKYARLAATLPLELLAPSDVLAQFKAESDLQSSAADVEQELRSRIDTYHREIFQTCAAETTARWPFEQEIKRPYFHILALDEAQLANWRAYLDWEESQGNYQRIAFLYERCLVTAAYYDEFWLRYARWMLGQMGKTEEVRNIYQRASCIYAPIARPTVRHQYALFEEMQGRVDVALAIYEAMLTGMPGHVQTIIAWAHCVRRNGGLDAAIEVLDAQIQSGQCDNNARAALIVEWANLLWKIKCSPEEARQRFRTIQEQFTASHAFWAGYLAFEIAQPIDANMGYLQLACVKQVYQDIRRKSQVSDDARKSLGDTYTKYLLECGTTDVAKEVMTIDREINGYDIEKSNFVCVGGFS